MRTRSTDAPIYRYIFFGFCEVVAKKLFADLIVRARRLPHPLAQLCVIAERAVKTSVIDGEPAEDAHVTCVF